MGIAELHQAGPLERSALFRESFYSAQSNSLLAVKKNWEASKAYVSQISKKWKTRFQEESVRTEVQGELPVCPTLGTDRAGTSPGHLQPPQAVCLVTGVRMGFGIALGAGYPAAITADFI